jgi:hypothetical protein
MRLIIALQISLFAGVAAAQSPLPNPAVTPGAVNPAVSESNIATTICRSGWTRTIRPRQAYTNELKHRQLGPGGSYAGGPAKDFEEDHLIPLELGGAPSGADNLWPEPRHPPDGWSSDKKDDLEGVLNRLVCSGRLPLAAAQQAVAHDWTAAYRQFVLAGDVSQRMASKEKPAVVARSQGSNGYYMSSDGSMIHTPATGTVDYGPVTAICADGSRSFSHHTRGTCSHHGGVQSWQAVPPG